MSDEIVLASKYWDCECIENFIHPFYEVACSRCKARRVWQPQSRVNEVIAHGLPLVPARRPTKRAPDLGQAVAKDDNVDVAHKRVAQAVVPHLAKRGQMIISAVIIKRPRKQRDCDNCHRPVVGEVLRLYGMAEIGDRPYAVYLHPTCDQSKEVARKLASGTTTRAVDLLDASAKSALVAQPANH